MVRASTECWVWDFDLEDWILYDNGPLVAKDRESAREVLAVCKKIGFCPPTSEILGWLCGQYVPGESGIELEGGLPMMDN